MIGDYDIAMSFAGEDRDYVEQVAHKLVTLGVKVFYDISEGHILLGRRLRSDLDNIYRLKSKFVVIFMSKSYASKEWCRLELSSVLTRPLVEQYEYVLPVRFDDTPFEGIQEDTAYIDARKVKPAELAGILHRKLAYYKIATGGRLACRTASHYVYYEALDYFKGTESGRHLFGIFRIVCISDDVILFLREMPPLWREIKSNVRVFKWAYPYESFNRLADFLYYEPSKNFEFSKDYQKLGITLPIDFEESSPGRPAVSRSGRYTVWTQGPEILIKEYRYDYVKLYGEWMQYVDKFEFFAFSPDERLLVATFKASTFEGDPSTHSHTDYGALLFSFYRIPQLDLSPAPEEHDE